VKNILLAYDGSKSSEKALKKTFKIAEKFDSAITIMTVAPELYLTELLEVDRKGILEKIRTDAEKTMQKIQKRARQLRTVKTVIKQGDAAEEILKTAKRIKADLIITGSHGRHGASKFLLGSVSAKIIDHAHCAVLIVK
jgi:nucleotide-binding universal stress UspA family protein